jgi:hypothetical protein
MKATHHKDKALKSLGCYMCLMIDGMDKKKHMWVLYRCILWVVLFYHNVVKP